MSLDEFLVLHEMVGLVQLVGFLAAWGLAMLTGLFFAVVTR